MKNITNNPKFIFYYRLCAFILSLWGIVSHIGLFTDNFRPEGLMTYTVQSNIFACIVFFMLMKETGKRMKEAGRKVDYGFYSPLSFAAMIDIILTMLIFWVVLAPTNWAGLNLFSADNLMVHLFTPLMIISDRIMFCKDSKMKAKDILYAVIYPYIYIIEAYINGKMRLVKFGSIDGGSYYLYPFLNFDKLGWKVFIYVALLTVFFLLLGYVFYRWEKSHTQK